MLATAAGANLQAIAYYFGSKEDFGLQVLERFVGIAKARLESYLTDASVDPITRLRNYFDWYGGYLESIQCSRGCMIAGSAKLRRRVPAN